MPNRSLCSALILMALFSAGCDKLPSAPAAPRADAASAEVPRPFAPLPDPSVPAANSVPGPAPAATAKDDSSNRPKSDMTKAEESSAMPKAGQANNHSSTALDPKKPASAP